jgi:uncharacterized membrane-anchored protein
VEIPNNNIITDPTELIRFVQQRRMETILNGNTIDKDQALMLTAIAKTAMDENKLKVESNGVKAQRELASVLSNLVCQAVSNPFATDASGETLENKQTTLTEEELPDIELIEGETSTELSTLTYKELYNDVE